MLPDPIVPKPINAPYVTRGILSRKEVQLRLGAEGQGEGRYVDLTPVEARLVAYTLLLEATKAEAEPN